MTNSFLKSQGCILLVTVCFYCLNAWNMFCMSHICKTIMFPCFKSLKVSCFCSHYNETKCFPHIQFVIIVVSSFLLNFSLIFTFKTIFVWYLVCFGFVFAKIDCTFMFAMAQLKYVFDVSVSFLCSGLSLFYNNPYLLFLFLSFAFLIFACLNFACLSLFCLSYFRLSQCCLTQFCLSQFCLSQFCFYQFCFYLFCLGQLLLSQFF